MNFTGMYMRMENCRWTHQNVPLDNNKKNLKNEGVTIFFPWYIKKGVILKGEGSYGSVFCRFLSFLRRSHGGADAGRSGGNNGPSADAPACRMCCWRS